MGNSREADDGAFREHQESRLDDGAFQPGHGYPLGFHLPCRCAPRGYRSPCGRRIVQFQLSWACQLFTMLGCAFGSLVFTSLANVPVEAARARVPAHATRIAIRI